MLDLAMGYAMKWRNGLSLGYLPKIGVSWNIVPLVKKLLVLLWKKKVFCAQIS